MKNLILMVIVAFFYSILNANIEPTPIERGRLVYEKHCMTCHQRDGGGVQNLNPPLIKTTYVLGEVDALVKIILKGMNEEIEIEGDVYANPMPAHDFLTDQQIADVLSYVRNSFGNKASMITDLEVRKLRK